MSFRVDIRPPARRGIASWGLSDSLIVDVYLRLNEALSDNPWRLLRPSEEAEGGMIFAFSIIDPENRFLVHSFFFQVYYAQDEVTIHVTRGQYKRFSWK